VGTSEGVGTAVDATPQLVDVAKNIIARKIPKLRRIIVIIFFPGLPVGKRFTR